MTADNGDRVDEVLIKYGDDCIEGKAVYTYRLKEARAALDTAYGTRMLELIGEDEASLPITDICSSPEEMNAYQVSTRARYALRAELRQKVKETYGL